MVTRYRQRRRAGSEESGFRGFRLPTQFKGKLHFSGISRCVYDSETGTGTGGAPGCALRSKKRDIEDVVHLRAELQLPRTRTPRSALGQFGILEERPVKVRQAVHADAVSTARAVIAQKRPAESRDAGWVTQRKVSAGGVAVGASVVETWRNKVAVE